MKRNSNVIISVIFIVSLIVFASTNVFAASQNDISVTVDGYTVEFDVEPTIINGRTMVPLRAIFEALGASVEWEPSTKTVTSTKADITVSLAVGSKNIYINGKEETLDEPATIIDGRTLVPVRAISEAFECNVEWENVSRTVFVETSGEEREKYNNAMKFIESGNYEEAYRLFEELGSYKDSAKKRTRFMYVFENTMTYDPDYHMKYYYNEKNLPSQIIVENEREKGIYNLFYDTNGNMIELSLVAFENKTTVDFSNEKGLLMLKIVCDYDSNNNLIKLECINGNDGTWVIENVYDLKGNLIKVSEINWNGMTTVREYVYDEKGRLIKEPGNSIGVDYCEYIYDSAGNVIKKIEYRQDGKIEKEHTYDSAGKIIKETYGDNLGGMDFTYDANGRLIKQTQKVGDLNRVAEFTYDKDGNKIHETYEESSWFNGKKRVSQNEYSHYTYNLNGDIVKKEFTNSDGRTSIDEYSYDEKGRLIRIEYKSDTDVRVHEVAYDESGNITMESEEVKGQFKNVANYTYDENGNIIKEVMTTKNGSYVDATYTYKFIYCPYDFPEYLSYMDVFFVAQRRNYIENGF